MGFPTITNTFVNATTADATQVNQNFTDILNGISDGTKDINIAAFTAAGTATFNGAVTLGAGSSNDISILGSIAATIPVKTNASFDFGSSTKGMASYYIGGTSTFTTRLASLATASYTFSFPAVVGSANQVLENNGSSSAIWATRDSADFLCNLSLSCSVGTNALTIALKDAAGSDASAASPIKISFRSSTLTTGTYAVRSVTSSLSLVISSGSTLGHVSTIPDYIYVYALDNAGTVELAASSIKLDEGGVYTSVAEGGAGAADSRTVLYSTTARTSKAIRLIGRLFSTQTTAGTWAAVPTETSCGTRFVEPAMDDIHASKMGFKRYLFQATSNPTYNGGNSIALTSGAKTIIDYRGYLIPRQLQDGTWTVSGKFYGQFSDAAAAYFTFALSSITAESITSLHQAVTVSIAGGSGARGAQGSIQTNTTLFEAWTSATSQIFYISLDDLFLGAKPNWVY